MEKRVESIAAVILFTILTAFLFVALTVKCSGAMDPVRQQIKEESMIM